jgi:multidrug transporter EmrE-like cation transporter
MEKPFFAISRTYFGLWLDELLTLFPHIFSPPHRLGTHILGVMNVFAWLIFGCAAFLEVTGDAFVRRGMRNGGLLWIVGGCATLAGYSLLVNSVRWDFSKLIGVYVAFFALASVLFGRFSLHEHVPRSTWLGLAVIITGGLIIQFGGK